MKFVDARYIEGGDWVTGQRPMMMFPASNKPLRLAVCEVWQFNANREADEGHNYSGGLGLLMQLGHLKMRG